MTLAEAVVIRIKALLNEKNKTRYQIQKATCLDRTTFQAMFKGKTKDVKLSTIGLIAEAFEMTMSEFLDDDVFKYENLDY